MIYLKFWNIFQFCLAARCRIFCCFLVLQVFFILTPYYIGATQSPKVNTTEPSTSTLPQKEHDDFKKVLKNMTKKTLAEYINRFPNSFYINQIKTNLDAIEEAESGFGKCFLVLKNGTRINLAQESLDIGSFDFSDKYVRVDSSSISFIELRSATDELEPYLNFLAGRDFRVWFYSSDFQPNNHQKGNVLIPSERIKSVIKYKIKVPFDKMIVVKEPVDKFDVIHLLSRNSLKKGADDFKLLSKDDQNMISEILMDITWSVSDHGKVQKFFRGYDSPSELTEVLTKRFSGRFLDALIQKIPLYSSFSEEDLLILPSTHGKNDYYPFIVVK